MTNAEKLLYKLRCKIDNVFYIPSRSFRPLADEPEKWYFKTKKIAHALGAVGGKAYTNSISAFNQSYEKGAKTFEADVSFTKDSVAVLSYDSVEEFLHSQIKGKVHTLSEFAEFIPPDVFIILDIKDGVRAKDAANVLLKSAPPEKLGQFVFQITSSRQFCEVKEVWGGFNNFLYNFGLDGNPNTAIKFLLENKIHAASVAKRWALKPGKLKHLLRYNIKCFAFTINDAALERELLERRGIWGIFTDNLL
ncbi:MAG: hypothetical protein IKS15_00290 [Opitutales bacterium]|nr:hypothetical protein [Opitutales bacterium]